MIIFSAFGQYSEPSEMGKKIIISYFANPQIGDPELPWIAFFELSFNHTTTKCTADKLTSALLIFA